VGQYRLRERQCCAQARLDDGKTGNADPFVCYYHDVPRALTKEALRRERGDAIERVRRRDVVMGLVLENRA
jgi:hypothetical protein